MHLDGSQRRLVVLGTKKESAQISLTGMPHLIMKQSLLEP